MGTSRPALRVGVPARPRAQSARAQRRAAARRAMMTLALGAWLVLFALEAAAVGGALVGMVTLADLENDFVNPHDCARRANAAAAAEVGAHAAAGAAALLSGRWIVVLLQAAALGIVLRDALARGHGATAAGVRAALAVDPTDVFATLQEEKTRRAVRLSAHMAIFVVVTVRLVQAALSTLVALDPLR